MKMHMGKTKVMFNKFAKEKDIIIENQSIEKLEEYVYLGTLTKMSKKLDIELSRRITAGWKAFWKYKDVLKSKLPICMKRKIFNQCILPVLTYGCETWTSTKKINQRLAVTQRAMERSMLGITRRDRKSNKWIREQTKVMDVVEKIRTLKWRWAGHVARMQDNRWTNVITSWYPRDGTRKRGRQETRWRDDIVKAAGATLERTALDRQQWKTLEEAFVLQWTLQG